MKKLILFTLVSAAVMSCKEDRKVVLFRNGARIQVLNRSGIEYGSNTKVCVANVNHRGWSICTDGEMQDSVIVKTMANEAGRSVKVSVIHKTGIIQ